MDDGRLRHRRLRDLVDESKMWDAEFLIRNIEDEFDRLEHGMAHMLWGQDEKVLTRTVRPMPLTPSFDIDEDDDELKLRVALPDVPKENMSVNVSSTEIEVFACPLEASCRPYYLSIEAGASLDADSADAHVSGDELEVRVKKAKKRLVPVV